MVNYDLLKKELILKAFNVFDGNDEVDKYKELVSFYISDAETELNHDPNSSLMVEYKAPSIQASLKLNDETEKTVQRKIDLNTIYLNIMTIIYSEVKKQSND